MEAEGLNVANRIEPILIAVDKGRTMVALKAAAPELRVPKTWIISAPSGCRFNRRIKASNGLLRPRRDDRRQHEAVEGRSRSREGY
jgi:hypothetical protein